MVTSFCCLQTILLVEMGSALLSTIFSSISMIPISSSEFISIACFSLCFWSVIFI